MGIGFGVLLIIVGLILVFALKVNIPYVSDDVLGWILIIGGVLVIVLVLVLNAQRRRTAVQPTRYEDPPPPPTL